MVRHHPGFANEHTATAGQLVVPVNPDIEILPRLSPREAYV